MTSHYFDMVDYTIDYYTLKQHNDISIILTSVLKSSGFDDF